MKHIFKKLRKRKEEKEEVDNIFHNTEENISITKNVIVHNVANVVEEENQFINPLSKDIIKGKVNQTVSSLSGLINNIENNPENIEIINKIKNDVVSLLNKKLKETENNYANEESKKLVKKEAKKQIALNPLPKNIDDIESYKENLVNRLRISHCKGHRRRSHSQK